MFICLVVGITIWSSNHRFRHHSLNPRCEKWIKWPISLVLTMKLLYPFLHVLHSLIKLSSTKSTFFQRSDTRAQNFHETWIIIDTDNLSYRIYNTCHFGVILVSKKRGSLGSSWPCSSIVILLNFVPYLKQSIGKSPSSGFDSGFSLLGSSAIFANIWKVFCCSAIVISISPKETFNLLR